MGNRKWTERSALRFVRNVNTNRKLITLDGKATLTECGAMDFLKNHCGYRII